MTGPPDLTRRTYRSIVERTSFCFHSMRQSPFDLGVGKHSEPLSFKLDANVGAPLALHIFLVAVRMTLHERRARHFGVLNNRGPSSLFHSHSAVSGSLFEIFPSGFVIPAHHRCCVRY